MSLGTKINLVLILVATIILTAGFWVIVSIEGVAIKQQVKNDSETVAYMFRNDIEHMFRQAYNQQEALQSAVSNLSKVDGVKYINVVTADGVYAAATDSSLIGVKASEETIAQIDKIKAGEKTFDIKKDIGTTYVIKRFIPIYLDEAKGATSLINIVEIEVIAISSRQADIFEIQKLLQVISVTIEQNAKSITVARVGNLRAIQRITDDVTKFGFYHDFIIHDDKLKIIANTGNEPTIFDNDKDVYKQLRSKVLSGKSKEELVRRIHNDHDVVMQVFPIQYMIAGKLERVGLLEIHVLISAYQDKINALTFRMIGIGVILTAILVIVLGVILRREVVEPITRYSKIAQKVADGDLGQTIEGLSNDEIGQFGKVFNSMVSNIRELDQLKSDFITVAAHQLRTPLSGIKWALKMIMDGDLGAVNNDQKDMLKRGYETSEKMAQLVNDLLNISRIESGKYGFKFEKNDFAKLLKTLITNTELASQERNIKVILDNRAGDIQPFSFDADKLLIALQNIVDNAIKYTLPGGRVTVSVENQGDYLQVKVSDTGVGVPKEDLPKLFSKFFRASNVVQLQTDGSGLGLFLVKSIIVHHGGQVWVDSIEGKGTTFTVRVPMIAELIPKEEIVAEPVLVAPEAKS